MNDTNGAKGRLAARRKEKGLTQAELAQRVGIAQRTVAAYESGERRPSVKVAKKIGEVLGIFWTVFYEEDGRD